MVLDSGNVTSRRALLDPVGYLPAGQVTVVASVDVADALPTGWSSRSGSVDDLDALAAHAAVVLSTGHFLPLGSRAWRAATGAGRPFLTVQHGLLTPYSPPLAPGTTLLAWSDAEADFWRAGRADVTSLVTGSALLDEAARAPSPPVHVGARPVYLGQLHGAELPREQLARSAEAFCLAEHAVYRPHPAETDRVSRSTHQRWERRGITIDRRGVPLAELAAPVVSVFSTGVLEAAARGLPAWVHLLDPPAWLTEFWTRYSMHPWGMPSTPPPALPTVPPAQAVAKAAIHAGGL